MIENERQYHITQAEASRFDEAIAELDEQPAGAWLHPLLVKAQRDALESQYDELREELSAYERRSSGTRRS